MTKFNRGSEWRKWDLHVHTPGTKLNDHYKKLNKKDDWDLFCSEIEKSDVDVFGITDYFSIENYFTFIEKFKNKYSNSKKVFFPNLELRFVSSSNGKGDEHHIHLIFDKDYKEGERNLHSLLEELVNEIKLVQTDEEGRNLKISSLETESDFQSACIGGFDKVKEGLEKVFGKKEKPYIILSALHGYGGIQPKETRKSRIAEEIDKITNLFFGCDKKDREFALEKRGTVVKKKPVVSGSDSHSFEDLKKKMGVRYLNNVNEKEEFKQRFTQPTWIKADPTFEGLKQIIYEPKDRVKIQENSPEFDFNKPYFEAVDIVADVLVYDGDKLKLKKNNLKLNKNLITIIGGRGEGKSTIVNYLGNAFSETRKRDPNKNELAFTENKNFSVEYHKINNLKITESDKQKFLASEKESNKLDFVFIEQESLKKNTEKDLSGTLKKMLNLVDAYFSKDLNSEISTLNQRIDGIEKWKEQKDEFENLLNSRKFHESIIRKNKILLENLKNSKNKEKIENFNENLKEISEFKETIDKSQVVLEITNNFIIKIADIISNNEIFNKPELGKYKESIQKVKKKYQEKINIKIVENEIIKKELLDGGISGDLTSLLEDTTKYQNLIDESKRNIEVIDQQEVKLQELRKERSELGVKIKEDYERQKAEIDNGWDSFLTKHPKEKQKIIKDILLKDDKIIVSGKIIFDKIKFYEMLFESVHQGSHKKETLEKDFKISDLNSWSDYIEKNFNAKFESLNHKKQEFLSLFFSTEKRSQYLRTEAEIKYDNRELSKLSAGQKGTAYLRIQLANSAFDKPIIFDQPEDDLDNKFIMDELIGIFRELKKYRQIIIVTHNANLVINADAEQVIIAKNKNEALYYISGSLENKDIQKYVCDILEGGKIAFEQRRKKYNLK